MGLIKSLKASLQSTLEDQYLEYFYCDSLSDEILIKKGEKKNNKKSFNKGSSDVISNGSGVVVNEGQCVLMVSEGRIVDVCAEPGVYTFEEGAEPSVFTGELGESLAESFLKFGQRFIHGGTTPANQRVYYVNTKEILGNKFGTANPIPFRIMDARTGIDFDISVRCFGTFSFKITDPVRFFQTVSGNVSDSFTKSQITNALREEMLDAMIPAFEKVASLGIRYSELGKHTGEVRDAIMESLDDKWIGTRGIYMTAVNFQSVDIPPEDLARIKEIQYDAVYTNQSMLGAKLGLAQAEAMKAAASNGAGAMMGFAGMNMAGNMGNATGYASMVGNGIPAPTVNQANASSWTCSCGTVNTGKFCSECGAPNPNATWECPKCKTVNTGKFCSECGTSRN